jgi:thymidylate synthase (FAD)
VSISQPLIPGISTAEELMVYCARVSNPANQLNTETGHKLLKYCMKNKHWSVFEMADITVEITTSRAIAAQILRHRSFQFQEQSQRYSESSSFETYPARAPHPKNRQLSEDTLDEETKLWWEQTLSTNNDACYTAYREALDRGVAKECARMLLPLNTTTTLYMKGSVRSWITYFLVRLSPDTQKEHRDVARAAFDAMAPHLPVTASILREDYPELFG